MFVTQARYLFVNWIYDHNFIATMFADIVKSTIMTSSNENIFMSLSLYAWKLPVTGGLSSKRDSNMNLWCFFDASHNKLLNKHSVSQWFETPWRSFDVDVMQRIYIKLSQI